MNDKVLFCKNKYGKKIKIGRFTYDTNLGIYKFLKNKPHKMRVIGSNGGYGIQRQVLDEKGKTWDLQEIFRRNPEIVIYIHDFDTGEQFTSVASSWIEHQFKGNYGDGTQMFLAVDYMKKI